MTNYLRVGVYALNTVLAGSLALMLLGNQENKQVKGLENKVIPVKVERMPVQSPQYQAQAKNLAQSSSSQASRDFLPQLQKVNYSAFGYQNEVPVILKTAERFGIEPELLIAIRMAENGRDGLQFGIMPTKAYESSKGYQDKNGNSVPYKNTLEKQASWCASTIKRNRKRFDSADKQKYSDFIDFLGDRYCPVNASNDPTGLNKNWERNVRKFYFQLKGR